LFVSSVAAFALAAETKPAPAKPAAADVKTKAETKAPVKGPKIAVDPPEHDFGKAQQNKTLTKEFNLKNLGNEDLVIGEITTSCGCTVAQLTTKTLKPGASTALTVNLETRVVSGHLERTITIPSNDPTQKSLQLKVTAEVAPASDEAKPQQ
jgi:hypothetical protein